LFLDALLSSAIYISQILDYLFIKFICSLSLGMAIYRQFQISDVSISYIYIFRYIAAQYR
jgi:hypothetical protein